jgi:hypothetical protein
MTEQKVTDKARKIRGGNGRHGPKKLPKNKKKAQHKHCLWIDYRSIKLDGRSNVKKEIDKIKRDLILHNGGASAVEVIFFENLAFDIIKKRLYDAGIIRQESFGSRDHSLALGNSIDRRLSKIGFKPKKKAESLDEYVRSKYGGGQ